MQMSDQQFHDLIARAIDELPRRYIDHLDNVAITYENEPTPEQLTKQGVREGDLLLGLYEGVPLTERGAGYNLVLPDKITIFKQPILQLSHDEADFYQRVKHTLWHEIAHHYGLDHDRIHGLENRS